MARPKPLSGFPEFLPAGRIVENRVLDVVRSTFELHGFAPIETRASDSTRVWRYSTLAVRLFCKVTSTPSRGENDSLMLTVETLYIELGMGLPVVASVIKPMPGPMSSMKVE